MSAPGSVSSPRCGNICLACGTPLDSMGTEQFRIGGTSCGIKLLLGEWAELGEQMLPLEMLLCPACRRVEFRLPWEPLTEEETERALSRRRRKGVADSVP